MNIAFYYNDKPLIQSAANSVIRLANAFPIISHNMILVEYKFFSMLHCVIHIVKLK